MDRIKENTKAIIEIKRSVFTADVVMMTDETLIKPYLDGLKALYPKSNHITYAAHINEGAFQKYSDDGEPKGTAGYPILEAITYYDLTDIVVTVRRDFGGVLLGASGLVRAYREAAHEALKKVERLKKKTTLSVSFQLTYKEYEHLKVFLSEELLDLEPHYSEIVLINGFILKNKLDAFKDLLFQRVNRQLDLNVGPEKIQYLADE